MDLDLRSNGKLHIEYAKEITSIEPMVRNEYNEYVGNLIAGNATDDLFWLLKVTCRNTYVSKMHDSFCRITLFDRLLSRNINITRVLVDSIGLQKAIERVGVKHGVYPKIICENSKLSIYIRVFKNFILSFWLILNNIIWPVLIRNSLKPKGNIIYLDTFLTPETISSDGLFHDRYYPGLIDNLSSVDKKRVWFAPTAYGFYKFTEFFNLRRKLKKTNTNLLIMEDWLNLEDYFSAFLHSLVSPVTHIKIPLWNNIVVNEIVKTELYEDILSPALIFSILRYKFIKNIKNEGIKIDVVIDWNENQVIDRALNMSVRRYYPETYIKGYQGFVAPNYYACTDPTCYEVDAGTIPDEILVVGNKYVENKKKNCDFLKVAVAPAFRFSHIYQYRNTNIVGDEFILVALPLPISDCIPIIEFCNSVVEKSYKNTNFIIRLHPVHKLSKIKEMISSLNSDNFTFSSKSLYEDLLVCSILLTTSSSVSVEAAVIGKKVGVVGSLSGASVNPLSDLDGLSNWKLCFTYDDLNELIKSESLDDLVNIDDYFSRVTTESVNDLVATH